MPKIIQAFVTLLLICLSMQVSAVDHNLTPISLQLKYSHQFQFAGYYAAKQQGYYADEGLHVEFREWSPQQRVIDQVVNGVADFGIGDPTLLFEFVNGQPIVALAAIFQESPLALFAKTSSGIQTPHDLIAKTVMYNSNGVGGADIAAMLAKQGVASSQFNYLEHNHNYQGLINGDVDVISGYLTDSPYFYAQQQTPVTIIQPKSYGINFYGDILFTSQQKRRNNPENVEKFTRASLKGWQYAVTHIDEMVTLITTQYKPALNREQLIFEAQETVKLMNYPIVEVGHMHQQRWTHIADVFQQQGLINKEVDFERFIYKAASTSYLYPVLLLSILTILLLMWSLRNHLRHKQLIKNLDRLNFAFGTADQGWFDLNVQTGAISVSDEYPRLLGFDPAEFHTDMQEWQQNLHPDDRDYVLMTLQQNLASGDVCEMEYRRKTKAGDWLWLHTVGQVIEWDKKGQPLRGVGVHTDITGRKQAELKLLESESRLQEAQRYAHIGYWDLLRDSTIATWSEQMYIIFGLAADVESGPETLCDILNESDCSSFMASLQHSFATGEEHHIEYQINRRNDGELRWIECRGYPIIDAHGEVERISGFIQDITERKNAEQLLIASEERLRLSQSSGGIGTWEYNFLTNKSVCSVVVLQQLGFPLTENESTWEDVFKAIYAEDAVHVNEVIDQHIKQGSPLDVEYRITDSQGNCRWMRTIGKAECDASGNAVTLRGTVQEITAKKAADEKLQLSARVFNETREGITITNAQKEIVDVNPAFCQITGYRREDVLGKNPRILSSGKQPPQFYEDMWQNINEYGHWQGEVWNRTKTGELYAELLNISTVTDDKGNISNYVGVFTDITRSKHQQEELSRMAHYDLLTQLPNRSLFADRFQQATAHSKRSGHQLAVCFLDLDEFKPVNDNYGHKVGDQLLKDVAARIKDTIREEDTVSRQGGDEFALLLGEIESFTHCEQFIDRILETIAQPYIIDGISHRISASCGITLYPFDNADLDTLLRHADHAMYQAKQAGRNRHRLFSVSDDELLTEKQQRLAEVEQALINNELCLYYQPKVHMLTGEVFGVEALIRWRHPTKGLIPPLDFLPIIEDTELELKVGEWVINQALIQIDHWQEQGIKLEVSVNISSRHLQSISFYNQLDQALAKHPIVDSNCLQLEILESSALGDLNAISRIIKTCQDTLGVNIALDDFGTGYSSLTHLRNLSANTIKIDQSFVRDMLDDPSDYAIIDGVIGLADAFNRNIIAEGVETTEHGLILLTMGCDAAQGYAIAKPMPANDFPAWLKNYIPTPEWLQYANKLNSIKENKRQLFKLVSEQWLKRFKQSLMSPADSAKQWPTINAKHDHCGQWIKREKKALHFDQPSLLKLEQAHDDFHAVAHSLQFDSQQGHIKPAQKECDQLQAAFDKMAAALD